MGIPYVTAEVYDWKRVDGNDSKHEDWIYDDSWGKIYPESEFRLSAFGLPEPPGVRWPLMSSAAWIAIIGALVFGTGLWSAPTVQKKYY